MTSSPIPAADRAPQPAVLVLLGRENTPEQPARRLELWPDRLVAERTGGVEVVGRGEFAARVQLLDGFFLRRLLLLRGADGSRIVYRLDAEEYRHLVAWRGPPTHDDLRAALRQRLSLPWTVCLGGLLLLLSLPQDGGELNLLSCALGAWLVGLGLAARLSPHRILFLGDVVFFLMAGTGCVLAWQRDPGAWWWAPLCGLIVWFAVSEVKQFQRFAETDEPPAS
jgi:hypothetical protein